MQKLRYVTAITMAAAGAARGDGGQVAAGCAAIRGDEEDVTRAASRSLAASRPRAAVTVTMSGPRAVNGTPTRG
jgi:hypothetical protein